MNEITLSGDKKTAVIGPGNRWGAIYTKLAEQNLTVIGGRASDVGLGLVVSWCSKHTIKQDLISTSARRWRVSSQ